jgi:hypothetical protein
MVLPVYPSLYILVDEDSRGVGEIDLFPFVVL